MARKTAINVLMPAAPPVPPGMSGPPYSGDTPNYDRDPMGGIVTRTPVGPCMPESAPPLDAGLASRRKLRY